MDPRLIVRFLDCGRGRGGRGGLLGPRWRTGIIPQTVLALWGSGGSYGSLRVF